MGSNRFGTIFQWTTFGESHGLAMGVVIDGCPAGIPFDEELLLTELNRRKPGSNSLVSDRNETDRPEILSGIFENKTLGTPIAVVVRNQDQRSKDYESIKNNPRIGHADDMWKEKFGHSDYRGGGRASARETVNWVIAGSFAQMFCKTQAPETKVKTELLQVGPWLKKEGPEALTNLLSKAKEDGESYGGIVQLKIEKPPAHLGEPIFNKIKSQLAQAFMSINACCGVELGEGFRAATIKGSEFHTKKDSEVYGGLRGGISTGETIQFQLAFKPTSSIGEVAKSGRHDPCIVLRALPVIEAMAWNVLADQILLSRLNK